MAIGAVETLGSRRRVSRRRLLPLRPSPLALSQKIRVPQTWQGTVPSTRPPQPADAAADREVDRVAGSPRDLHMVADSNPDAHWGTMVR